MEKLLKPGRVIFALGIIGLGFVSFISKDFIVGRPPATSWAGSIPVNLKLFLSYLAGLLTVLCGLGIIFNFRGRTASLIIGVLILVFSFLMRHQYEMTDWLNAYKALALCGGAFVVAASFPAKNSGTSANMYTNLKLEFAGTVFLSLFLILCGISHLKFYDFVKNFIPAYIPAHSFFTYFTAIALLAGGVGLIVNDISKWAALLSGIMIAGWFLLLHIPRFIANPSDASDRMGLFESFGFVGIFFVLAATLSGKNSLYNRNL
jgi:uncharacterized membrane protein YphA (DoxX/SURF4 family)